VCGICGFASLRATPMPNRGVRADDRGDGTSAVRMKRLSYAAMRGARDSRWGCAGLSIIDLAAASSPAGERNQGCRGIFQR